MTRLPLLGAQAEELWTVPVRARDQLSNLTERPVALSFVQHSSVEHPDLVRDPVPLAHQDRPRWRWLRSKRASRSRLVGEADQESSSRGFEPSVDLLLNSIRHRTG